MDSHLDLDADVEISLEVYDINLEHSIFVFVSSKSESTL